MVGGGIEHGLSRNWSVKVEYNYSNFGDSEICALSLALASCADFSIRQHVHW